MIGISSYHDQVLPTIVIFEIVTNDASCLNKVILVKRMMSLVKNLLRGGLEFGSSLVS